MKVSLKELKTAISSSNSMAEASSKLNIHFNTFKRYAEKHNLYNANQSGKGGTKKRVIGTYLLKDILDGKHPQYQSNKLRIRLCEEGYKENKCEKCGISEWNETSIQCELDHIDGNSNNHCLTNLRILCPNCHSQTDTFRAKNITRKKCSSGPIG